MSITTKKGDNGLTSLYGGKRVRKDNIRIEVCGILDELCSFLGFSKSLIRQNQVKKLLESIQQDLFIICTEVSSKPSSIVRLKKCINKNHINQIEKLIKELENKRLVKKGYFCMPGGGIVSSTLDIARTVTRRVERKIVTLKSKDILRNSNILIYLNRLSDLFYLLARQYGKKDRRLTQPLLRRGCPKDKFF